MKYSLVYVVLVGLESPLPAKVFFDKKKAHAYAVSIEGKYITINGEEIYSEGATVMEVEAA
jgi:hypothetical protein